MALFRRRRSTRPDGEPTGREARDAVVAHLREFVSTRVGVEAYVEPVTNVTQTTVVLIATTGEWTRRRVPDAATAWRVARELGIPVYDVQLTGYPQRMRDWNSRRRRR
ncbi:oxidoreductase [Cellulomonas sp. APG4]|uniref:oxidoreductase n=1 Tax=Cellulomonas sp. APG4 TaxID=1538656 RepID=UPI00137A8B52|nr:oxidoreductase [Cellulomonas sp. APG4]NCT90057.1 oxidoreductase [Cellulomonas sp. APG4]